MSISAAKVYHSRDRTKQTLLGRGATPMSLSDSGHRSEANSGDYSTRTIGNMDRFPSAAVDDPESDRLLCIPGRMQGRHARRAALAQDRPAESKQLGRPAARTPLALPRTLDEPAALDEAAKILLVQLQP